MIKFGKWITRILAILWIAAAMIFWKDWGYSIVYLLAAISFWMLSSTFAEKEIIQQTLREERRKLEEVQGMNFENPENTIYEFIPNEYIKKKPVRGFSFKHGIVTVTDYVSGENILRILSKGGNPLKIYLKYNYGAQPVAGGDVTR